MSGPVRPEGPKGPPVPVRQPPPRWAHSLWIIGFAFTAVLLFLPGPEPDMQQLTYSEWMERVDDGRVQTASIDQNGKVRGELANGEAYESRVPTALGDDALARDLERGGVDVEGTHAGASLWSIVGGFLPFLVLLAAYFFITRRAARQLGSGLTRFGSSRAKLYDEQRPTSRLADVAGYDGAKREISEVVDFLTEPGRYASAGAIGPRGVLMVGPPGTGKTLLARAVAGEAGVPFYAITGSGFVELFVGVGAARVRDLFATARKSAPAIVFIDEIDAIGQRRGASLVGNDEREQTLNQLLAEMDGFDPATGIVVLAATNRPETLDPALLRPGRFDRHVEIPLPNLRERAAILEVHTREKHLHDDVDLDLTGRATPGFSGADLANLVNEAAIVAVRDGRSVLQQVDFDVARDRILLGRRDSTNALMPQEKRAVAVHESGHALVATLSPGTDPVAKVTILPAGMTLGATEQLPVDERRLYGEGYLNDSLAVRLGGRAAELLVLGEASTGAANDLAGATELATRMVRDYGMSERLGPVGFSSDGPLYLGGDPVRRRSFAEQTQRVIDEEVAELLRVAERRALDLLMENRDALDRLVEQLLLRETVDGDAVVAALHPEPTSIQVTSGADPFPSGTKPF